jgi:nitrite reductase (NADH) large subunit
VVGGGITALELVEGLTDLGMKVHYILRGDRYWSNLLNETESRIVEHRLTEEGVKIHFNAQLAEILGKKGTLVGVRLQDGSEIPCTILAVAIGIRPRKELAATCGLVTKRGIQVGQYMETSAPDIFAAGDVAELVTPEHPDGLLESLWGPALRQGRTAALNMSGTTSPFIRPIPVNVTRLAGLVTTFIGQLGQDKEKSREKDKDRVSITRGESERWIQVPEATEVEDLRGENHLRIYIGNNRIRGALVMGDQTLSRPLQTLIEQQGSLTSVNELLAQLKAPGAQIPNLLYAFWQRNLQQNAYSLA